MQLSPTTTRFGYLAILVSVSMIYLIVIVKISAHQLLLPKIENLHTYSCTVKEGVGDRVLRIRNVISNLSIAVADELCLSKNVARSGYGHVEISWPPSAQISAKSLLSQDYDFLLNRHHNLMGLVKDIDDIYRPVLSFPSTPIYWWSKTEPFDLSPSFFENKRVGITTNTESHPLYLIPLKSLADAGVELSDKQLVLLPTPDTQIQAFAEGRVDLIMAADSLPGTLKHYKADFKLFRSEQLWFVPGLDWFASRTITSDIALVCDFVKANRVYQSLLQGYDLKLETSIDCNI